MNQYNVGDMVRLTASFVNSAGVGVDPSSIYAWHQVLKPCASDVTTIGYGVNSMVRLGAGSYYTDVAVNTDGEWGYRFRAYGANAAAVDGRFQVLLPITGF